MSGVSSTDFKRQLDERNAASSSDGSRRFRSSAAPKGTKLAAGYQDRTKLRNSEENDEKARRVQALEEMVKLGQMDEAAFEKVRDELIGGNIKDVHLVKGLDFKLLKRVRGGEDVLTESLSSEHAQSSPPPAAPNEAANVDDEFEELEAKEVAQKEKVDKVKSGMMAPPPMAGKKRSRDDILKDLRAARAATSGLKEPQDKAALGSRFSKIGRQNHRSRLERDEKGREVLILVDADGNEKRKVRKETSSTAQKKDNSLPLPDKDVAPLGMNVSAVSPQPPLEQEDLDIFEGVGVDFDPLGQSLDAESDDDGNSEEGSHVDGSVAGTMDIPRLSVTQTSSHPPRNYFDEPRGSGEAPGYADNPLKDPDIIAALKRASKIQEGSSENAGTAAADAMRARHQKLLETHDRDAEDMDLGFGGSRRGDEEDAEDGKAVRLSQWEGVGEEETGQSRGAKPARKRGPKRKKVDGENAAAVLKVLERRKEQAS